jgi:integral membrane protein
MTERRPLSRGVLLRYRVMAFTTAVLLIVLVFVGIPLQVFSHRPGVVNVVGTMHGFLYIVYLVVAFDLTRRLDVAKWKMLLVLAAGTVPFCAFVAERKMTRRFVEVAGDGSTSPRGPAGRRPQGQRGEVRRRWLSGRALVLHAEVLVLAPGCVLAGCWQATRALAGNGLSWVYSVEWPIFAVLAVIGWWHLVHEDPDAYKARRWRARDRTETGAAAPAATVSTAVDAPTVQWAAGLAAGTGAAMLVGFVALAFIPFGRPSAWVPVHGAALYGLHASVGLVVGFAALAFVVWARPHGRIARISSWSGMVCLAVSSAGGLLTEPDSIVRFLGVALMFLGAALALAAYLVPIALRNRVAAPPATAQEPVSA